MSNHLGNVLTVINDIKVPQSSNSVDVDGYLATIVSTADYSPFGVQLDGRTESAESYRYGFNGMEKDDEMKGAGNSYDFGMRLYDARIARFISIDPMKERNSHESNYTYASNNPIVFIDLEGGDNVVYLFVPKDGALQTTDKNNATCQKATATKIAGEANKMLETMNVGTRVVVFEGTYAEFQAMQIDNNDRRALVGAREDANTFLKDNDSGWQFDGWCHGEPDPLDLSPGVIAVSTWCNDVKYNSGLKSESDAQTNAFGIVHGTSHTTGAAHCGKDNSCVPDFKDASTPSYALSGDLVHNGITNKAFTMWSILEPKSCPLTILAHIKTFEPSRYEAVKSLAMNEANQQGFSGPTALLKTISYAASLLGNSKFIENAIKNTTPSPANDNREQN